MHRVAIVVLNYLNYADTIECVDSILKMKYSLCGIVIVDNASYNGAYQKLKAVYKNRNGIHIIKTQTNLGYAKGNNCGISYARKRLKADYVLVVNNDTVFIDKEYIKKLVKSYKKGIGVIGGKIILKGKCEQPPMVNYLGFKDSILRYLNRLSLQFGSSFEFPAKSGRPTTILHGCALMFTPDFFEKYKGFYKRTFLYGEEAILYLMCKCKGLEQKYVHEAVIFHKEDQSSMMSFQNDNETLEKYSFQSEKYIILWEIRYGVRLFFRK